MRRILERRSLSGALFAGLVVAMAVSLGLSLAPQTASAQSAALWDRDRLQFPPLREIQLPNVQRTVLPNGMVLYILEDHEFPVVQGRVLIRAGSMLDPDGKDGLARMVADVLRTGGSAKYPGDELDRTLEGIGARIETSPGQMMTSAVFWSLRENANDVLAMLADLLRRPAFPAEKIDLSKIEIRQEIASRNDQPMDILGRVMEQQIWGKGHPYARYPEYATIEAIQPGDLAAFHGQYYFPDRIYLTVWGDFDAAQMKKRIESLFGDWKASGKPAPELPKVAPIVPGGSIAYAEKTGTTNTWIVAGHVGLRGDDPDYAAMNVLNEILGGGFSSRLFNEIRTRRGLAYATGSSSGTDIPRPGVFFGYAGTRSDSALVVLDILKEEIARVTQEPPSADEMQKAKDSILNSYVFQFASKGQIASRMAMLDFWGYPEDFTARYPEMVKALTPEQILEAAKRNIHPGDLQVVLVGDKKDFAKPLSSLGQVQTIDLTIPPPPSKAGAVPEAGPEAQAKGREILAKAAQATGGQANWAAVKSVEKQTTVTVTMQGQTVPITSETIETVDGKTYVHQKLPFGEMTMASAGGAGWMKIPGGVQDLPPSQAGEMQSDRARQFWMLFANPESYDAQAVADETIDGKKLAGVLLKKEGVDPFFLFVDPATGRPAAIRYQGSGQQGPTEMTEIYDGYGEYGSLLLPDSIRILSEGQPFATSKVTKLVVNGPVDPKLFEKPAM
ncbi:MAG: M16 family metallopeptidase [Candidatus Eisenbacteria bacterium]|nr:pitrilysin family protein [Candidatus Eisenbacteria bacterium]